MNSAIAPIIINQRFARLFAWAGLWLVWAGAFLSAMSCGFRKSRKVHHPRRRIALMTQFVIATLFIRATHFVTHIKGRPRAYGPRAIAKRIMRGNTKSVRVFAPAFVVAALSAPLAISELALDSS